MTRTLVFTCATWLFASSAVLAQSGPTREEQAACRSDAMRYCSMHVGKPADMNACLRANKTRLGEGCKKVIESRGG
jgi:hypothetical protein